MKRKKEKREKRGPKAGLITVISSIIGVSVIITFISLRMANPKMTGAEVLLDYWYIYLAGIVSLFGVIYIQKKIGK